MTTNPTSRMARAKPTPRCGRARKATEAIIAERCAKSPHLLAGRLARTVANGARWAVRCPYRRPIALLLATLIGVGAMLQPPSGRAVVEAETDPPPLWIGVLIDEGEALTVIAHYINGVWDKPRWAIHDAPPMRAPNVIAYSVPRSWFYYSPEERGLSLTSTGLVVTRVLCSHRWALGIARDTARTGEVEMPKLAQDYWARDTARAGEVRSPYTPYRPLGIALTRRPAEVLVEEDIPGLEDIRGDLGFGDVSGGKWGKGRRSFRWLGIFRFDDDMGTDPADGVAANAGATETPTAGTPTGTTLGILWGSYYEGAEYILIEIDGERSRVIVRTYAGGC